MKLKAVLVDDEQENLHGMAIKLGMVCPEVDIAGTFTRPRDALAAVYTLQPDVLFLDIEMPGMNGFDFLEAIAVRNFEVIMVTGYADFAIKALKANAIDYLLKPVDIDELRTAVHKVLDRKQKASALNQQMDALSTMLKAGYQQHGKLTLHAAREVHFVQIAQIIRVAAENNYSIFYLANGKKITVSKTLGDFEAILADHHFFRIHKSHLINLNYLERLDKSELPVVIMTDGSQIEVSVRRKSDFLRIMER